MTINYSLIKVLSVILVSLILITISKKIVGKLLFIKSSKVPIKRQKSIVNLISNIVRCFILFIALTIILEEFGIDTKSFIASLGVFSLVIGLALQDLLKDIISGFSIVFEGLYNIGDWIEISSFKGEVIATSLRTTRIRAYTGEVKIISNRNITELTNYSMDDSNTIVDVEVSYDSKLDKVDKVISEMCNDFETEEGVKKVDILGLNEIGDSGLKFRLVVKSDYSNSIALSRKLKRKIVDTFNKNNISIPYKQVVIHNARL